MSDMIEMEWIDIKDRLPDEGKQVIAWSPNGASQTPKLMRQCNYICGDFYYGFHSNRVWGVTHWMELPPPPIDEEEGE